MKATGIVRRIDDLGRVVIPKEIRRTLRIREGDPLEIFTDKEGGVIFKKYSQMGGVSEFAAQLCDTMSKSTSQMAVITDRDSCVAVGGAPRRDLADKRVSAEVEHLMEQRKTYQAAGEDALLLSEDSDKYQVYTAVPILSEGDVLGCVILAAPIGSGRSSEVELILAQTVAAFLGRHMES